MTVELKLHNSDFGLAGCFRPAVAHTEKQDGRYDSSKMSTPSPGMDAAKLQLETQETRKHIDFTRTTTFPERSQDPGLCQPILRKHAMPWFVMAGPGVRSV